MKKDAYESSRMKHQLLDKRMRGVKEVSWKLNLDQVKFIQEKLRMEVVPYLFEVRTKKFQYVRNLDAFLKNIHYSNKKGKKVMVIKLTPLQMNILDEMGIRYRPYKYRIILKV